MHFCNIAVFKRILKVFVEIIILKQQVLLLTITVELPVVEKISKLMVRAIMIHSRDW